MIASLRLSAPAALAAVLLALAAAAPAAAHQCVEVEILRSPRVAQVGDLIVVAGAIANCGDPARAFHVSWVLVSDEGDRTLLRRAAVMVEPGNRVSGTHRLLLPSDVRPGHYGLALVGRAPSGFTDTEIARIALRPAD